MSKLKQVKEKIVKAVPEIKGGYSVCEIHGRSGQTTTGKPLFGAKIKEGRPITLEDVLMALEDNNKWVVIASNGNFSKDNGLSYDGIFWEFGKPLSEQSPETIDFLYNLLVSDSFAIKK